MKQVVQEGAPALVEQESFEPASTPLLRVRFVATHGRNSGPGGKTVGILHLRWTDDRLEDSVEAVATPE